jgi:hypothetical protein
MEKVFDGFMGRVLYKGVICEAIGELYNGHKIKAAFPMPRCRGLMLLLYFIERLAKNKAKSKAGLLRAKYGVNPRIM